MSPRPRPSIYKRQTPVANDSAPKILVFPKTYRQDISSVEWILKGQLCIVCNTYGCVPKYITPADEGGLPTGDNLLPVCEAHAKLPMHTLYSESRAVKRWLSDHERVDTILNYENLVLKR